MLGGQRRRFASVADALGRVLARARLRPDHVTWAGLVVGVAGAALVATGRFVAGGLVVALAGILDFADGALARASGLATRAGGYLDSLFDRFVDFAVLLGVLVAYDATRFWIVGSVAVFGSITTSFAKARVFQDLHPDPAVWRRDVLERGDRYLLLVPALIAQGLLDTAGKDVPVVWWVLVALAALSVLTVIQRMVVAWRVLREADRGG